MHSDPTSGKSLADMYACVLNLSFQRRVEYCRTNPPDPEKQPVITHAHFAAKEPKTKQFRTGSRR